MKMRNDMADPLPEPLTAALRFIATALGMGASHGVYSKGGGPYDWRGVIAQQHDLAFALLRTAVEGGTQGCRTIREAHNSSLPANSIFLVVVCAAGRAEGPVLQLTSGDILYLITAMRDHGGGLAARRLNRL
jgi:hypothetical protein